MTPTPSPTFNVNVTGLLGYATQMFNAIFPILLPVIGLGIGVALAFKIAGAVGSLFGGRG